MKSRRFRSTKLSVKHKVGNGPKALIILLFRLFFIYIVGGSFYSTFKFWLSTIKSKDKSDKLFPFTVAPQGP